MFERMLVGTDFSLPSEAVLSCVPYLQRVGAREVVLGHVVYVANTPGLETMLEDQARPALERTAQQLRDAGLQVTTDIRMGVPAFTLAEMADEYKVDVTVVGSHGRSLLGRMLLGSVSSGLLHQTSRPVLIVRVNLCDSPTGPTCEAVCEDLFGKMLFPTDFSAGSAQAFTRLTEIVAETQGSCTLLHVQDQKALRHTMDRLDEFNATDAARLEELRQALLAAGATSVETQIELGPPIRLIVEKAAQKGVSLIVMSTRGRGALAEVMVGSVAMNVARLAPVPVLFIPTEA